MTPQCRERGFVGYDSTRLHPPTASREAGDGWQSLRRRDGIASRNLDEASGPPAAAGSRALGAQIFFFGRQAPRGPDANGPVGSQSLT